jgi:hypothetical protein
LIRTPEPHCRCVPFGGAGGGEVVGRRRLHGAGGAVTLLFPRCTTRCGHRDRHTALPILWNRPRV